MLLYSDNLVELNYATAQDILYVEPQNRSRLGAPEIKSIFTSTVACVREQAVKRLIIAFDKSVIELSDAEYISVLAQLVVGLLPASVEKIARVASNDPAREEMMAAAYQKIRAAVALPFELHTFPNRAEALRWLTAFPVVKPFKCPL